MTKQEFLAGTRIDPLFQRLVPIYTEDGRMYIVETLREMFIEDQNNASALTNTFQRWFKDEYFDALMSDFTF